ncbi:MAG TPA: HAD-IC family P-type ATPase [Thermomicrobiales bacterium]|nr:HAD-IC family P-type ATPase [Thermomicrobiales bacterium]
MAGSLQETESPDTPLQRELDWVGKMLGIAVVIIAVVIGATIVLVNEVRSLEGFVDVLLLAVSLAVAAVPEGLTAITTVVLSLGTQRMARRRVIVRKLAAVETLGSTTVICSDKTGTLTRNEMTVRAVVTASGRVELTGTGYAPEGEALVGGEPVRDPALLEELRRVLHAAERASNATLHQEDGRWEVHGDPTEGALVVAAQKVGISPEVEDERFSRVGEIPFSSERKLMSTAYSDADAEDRAFVLAKGAPDVLLARCTAEWAGDAPRPLTSERRQAILDAVERLASEALRTLGVAGRPVPPDVVAGTIGEEVEQELVFLGLVGMIDPPRPEARESVRLAQGAGIRAVMITGDHPTTAAAIATELGIAAPDNRVLAGVELDRMDDAELRDAVPETSVYARVAPAHKLRIVRALQDEGEVVAMTGDGVNDAPALKTADIGVAMGITGTDVAKGAADMILTDDNFASIVAAVEEGRSIFASIQEFLRYLLSSNASEVLVMFFGVILADVIGLLPEPGTAVAAPLLATQILWINLVTDSGPALALGLEPDDPSLMQRPPRDPRSRVIDRMMWFDIVYVGAIMAVGTLLVADWAPPGGPIERDGTLAYAPTMTFTTLVFYQLYNVFNARSDERSAFRGLFTNRWLWAAVALSILLQIAVIYLPFLQRAFGTVDLSLGDWLVCLAVGSTVLWLRELVKLARTLRRG